MKETFIALSFLLVFFSCQEPQVPTNKQDSSPIHPPIKTKKYELEIAKKIKESRLITYEMQDAKQWLSKHKTDTLQQEIVFAINRTDHSNFSRMDSVIIPTDLSFDIAYYLPFPVEVDYLKDIDKIIFFSYPTQTFAAYEKGSLIYTGPTNMGRKKHLTPLGLMYTNWKAELTTSTINDEWILKWNFNILNKEGVGWHQYSMPGYPISHSCLRLQDKDAEYLYNWADQWILADKNTVLVNGTPVIVFGQYDFKSPKPWLQLISNPHSIDISQEEIQKITQAFFNEIIAVQTKRRNHLLQQIVKDSATIHLSIVPM